MAEPNSDSIMERQGKDNCNQSKGFNIRLCSNCIMCSDCTVGSLYGVEKRCQLCWGK